MTDGTAPSLFDALPANVKQLAADARRAVKAGSPDYLPATLCQVGLPRSPTPGLTFERTSGSVSLRIEAGRAWDGKAWQQLPLPYGVRPRLGLIHIVTEALRTNSPTVDIGPTVNAFLTTLGLDNGGKAYRQMRLQMAALAVCRLQLGRTEKRIIDGQQREVATTLDARPFAQFDAWIDNRGDQLALWPAEVQLTAEFFDSIRETAVPLEHAALGKLAHSALALDLYAWLASRLWRVRRGGSRISWAALQEQFGGEYADRRDFKREFRRRLGEVMTVYPDAKVELIEGGIMLHASPPPIPRRRAVVRRLNRPK